MGVSGTSPGGEKWSYLMLVVRSWWLKGKARSSDDGVDRHSKSNQIVT